MAHIHSMNSSLTNRCSGSREGADYRFIGDVDSLRQLAQNLIARLDGKEAGPWKSDPSVIVCDEIEIDRVFFLNVKQ